MERSFTLADQLRRELAALPQVTLRDLGRQQCAIVSFSHEALAARDLAGLLQTRDINISTSYPSSTLLDAVARDLPDLARASVHYYNTEEEVDTFVRAIADMS